MTKIDPKAKIRKLEKAQAKIAAELQQAKELEAEEERKRETRRKILIGAAFQNAAQKDPKVKSLMDGLLNEFLDKERDRGLFGLPARPD